MVILLRILVFIVCFAIGMGLIIKTEPWVNLVGHSNWAEEHIGGGGTYSMWKLIGVAIIIGGLLYMAGTIG